MMTTVIAMMLTPHAFELTPEFARAEWIPCNRNSIGSVRKPNHPFPASAAGAAADDADAAMAAASAAASESRSASASEERSACACWMESTPRWGRSWRRWRDDDGSKTAAESLVDFDDDGGRREEEEDDAGGANAAAVGAEDAATINDRTWVFISIIQ